MKGGPLRTGADKDLGGEDTLTKSQKKKLHRKAENQKVTIIEEDIKSKMDIDAGTGTELGAPF
jgi:hypothetical protein